MENKTILYTMYAIIPFIVLGVILISAENLTINETTIVNETIGEQANCSKELITCLDIYNSLVEDFREGTNCGTAFNLVKGMNEKLAEERDGCREEIGELKVYRVVVYILIVVLFITGVVLIVTARKKE